MVNELYLYGSYSGSMSVQARPWRPGTWLAARTQCAHPAAGVTAKFNLNLLARINRELGANFDLASFSHEAFYNAERHRIEMHLASKKRQKVRVAGRAIEFRAGETIHTENSYKYTLESFGALARGSGWTPSAVWTDDNRYFSVQALVAQDD